MRTYGLFALAAPLSVAALLTLTSPAAAQPKMIRIVAVEELQRAGIDRDALDKEYIDGNGIGCTECRFAESQRDAYDGSWNTFLSDLMNTMLQNDVSFSELVLRAYFSKDGTLDYLLYHVGGDAGNNERFIKAAKQVYSSFKFDLAASGPFKQCATISLGGPIEAQ